MPGPKKDEQKREIVKTLLYINPDMSERDIAKQAGIANSQAHYIKNEILNNVEDRDNFEQLRAIKKQEFINNAWELVKKSLLKINEKLESLTPEQLQKVNIRDLAVTMGTIYDKQALASGEATVISERKESTPELIKEYESKLQQLKKLVG